MRIAPASRDDCLGGHSVAPGSLLWDYAGWMSLQKTYELDLARQQVGKTLGHIPQRPPAAAPFS